MAGYGAVGKRISSFTTGSSNSAQSDTTVRPNSSRNSLISQPQSSQQSRRGLVPTPIRTNDEQQQRMKSAGHQGENISPTSTEKPNTWSTSSSNRRISDPVVNQHRDHLDVDRMVPQIYQQPPTAGMSPEMAPWMAGYGSLQSNPGQGSFYHDSSDTHSSVSQLSPGRTGSSFHHSSQNRIHDSPSRDEDRRPSVASIATTNSTGSKTSIPRGGFRKLQGFFGEEFPGRDSLDNGSQPPSVIGKDQRNRSYSSSRAGRKTSNATDQTREASPASSRPRTPVPAPEVVPFLYQDNTDIARYGEAPVRNSLTGPDRERYVAQAEASLQNPPKTSSSSRSNTSFAQPSVSYHRHNRSNDDPRSLRPTLSREDSSTSTHILAPRDKGTRGAILNTRPGAEPPVPSTGNLHGSVQTGASSMSQDSRNALMSGQGQSSPGHHGKFGLLKHLRRNHKDKEETGGALSRLRSLPHSSRSLQTKGSKPDFGRRDLAPSAFPGDFSDQDGDGPRGTQRGGTFNPFTRKPRPSRYQDTDEDVGPTDRPDGPWKLDTNLNDMEGILKGPPALPPMDMSLMNPDRRESLASPPPKGRWDAPDSWAVRRNTDDNTYEGPEADEIHSPPHPDEGGKPFCIRIFRSNGTYSTHTMPLASTVPDVISQVVKKTYVVDGLDNYHIVMKKQGLLRVLGPGDRPLLIQKRMMEAAGYEASDRIEEVGREDNSYLCRFMFLSAKESDFHSKTADLNITRTQKHNYVDLSARNLITIPISLYSKSHEIISLNLSRNLNLDIPRDFISGCKHLKDVKYNNNEARRLPPSLARANKLTYLDVSNNKIERIDQAELDTLTGLLKMNLANNRLKNLPSYFGAYQSLRSLNISSNFLERFPPFLCKMYSLVDLDLSFNSIESLPEQISDLKNLEKLLITNNRLAFSVPESFKELISLREIDIKYNGITSIDIISELPKLEILYADHNAISAFTGKFERLRQLKLNSNPLNKFEIEEPLPTLKTLNLSNAQLASINSTFMHVPNLENLILDKNYFVSLPPQIGGLVKLEHFSIANNSVGELPPQIGCLTELRVLNVRGNNISKLPMEIWWARKLETFNASSNVLDQFPKPASRPPYVPGEDPAGIVSLQNGKSLTLGPSSATPSSEDSSDDRRPSQASSTLLSVGPSPINDRKSSVVSAYGRGGRKTSVVSRSASQGTMSTTPLSATATRKDSSLSSRMTNTFSGSLRQLLLADNRLDDDVFDQITLLAELRVLNLSYNEEISDMPQRSIKSWPQLVELYLSGNGLTTLPADDLDESCPLQTLHINGNKFTNLPADISRAKKLAVLDCGNNSLKYNISNVPYDWNWNLNPNLRYLNLSGNKRLEIKQTSWTVQSGLGGPGNVEREQYTDFSRLLNLRILGLMDVTLTQPSIPDQSEDKRVRTSGSMAGHLPYGMADTLGKHEHLSTVDLVVPRFNSSETEMLLGLFDGQALSTGGSKIAKYLHENFGHIFAQELRALKTRNNEGPADALRRAFLAVNKDLATTAVQHVEDRPRTVHRGSAQPLVLSKEDLNSGGVATVAYLQGTELYVANVGDAQAMVIQADGGHRILTRKHDPAEPTERQRIREAGGWVSRNGRLNDTLQVSRAFGFSDLMPIVQACPHVSNMSIREQDDIIVMATRELWEYLSPGLVTDVARSERQDPMRAAQKLRDLAIAYGASGKIMVMMISVADLKKRVERSRLQRGASMSLYPSGVPDEALGWSTRRGRKAKGDVLDSSLGRLEAEIPAPTGNLSIVFTDIKNSTTLWEMYPNAMRSAIKLHNDVMRRQLRRIGGYEVKTEGDAFMVSFPTATSALLWCFAVQLGLLEVNWPAEVLSAVSAQLITDKHDQTIFKGLSVRMGIHYGKPVSETDVVTRRMDYFGPMVNKAARISAVADGGQIAVSSDFISEIQRCLQLYRQLEQNGGEWSEELDTEISDVALQKDLRSLTAQGFEVKEMGERKLKGLENPEIVYALYPHALVGRAIHHAPLERTDEGNEKPATLQAGAKLDIKPDMVWDLWKVSLRLEMLCSTLEAVRGSGLQPPETELMDRIKARGGEVTERFLINFMEHQVSRIEACISTLAMRHLARGGGPLRELDQLRGPMSTILDYFVQQNLELARSRTDLERYRAKYGDLSESDDEMPDDADAGKSAQKKIDFLPLDILKF